jgi:hypothetical protein
MILDYYGQPIEVGTRVACRDGGVLKMGVVETVRQKGGTVRLENERHLMRTGDRYDWHTEEHRESMNVRDLRSLLVI